MSERMAVEPAKVGVSISGIVAVKKYMEDAFA